MFNERMILSLAACKNCLVMDDELNILSISSLSKDIKPATEGESIDAKAAKELKDLKESLKENKLLGPLVTLAKTLDQAKAIMSLFEALTEKTIRYTIALTAGRGRVRVIEMLWLMSCICRENPLLLVSVSLLQLPVVSQASLSLLPLRKILRLFSSSFSSDWKVSATKSIKITRLSRVLTLTSTRPLYVSTSSRTIVKSSNTSCLKIHTKSDRYAHILLRLSITNTFF